jgi:fatty-acid desaturase
MYTRNNSGPNTVLEVLQKVHQALLTHTLQLAPVVFLKTRKMLTIVGFFHRLHSDKVYEVSAYAELCQTLWRNLGG